MKSLFFVILLLVCSCQKQNNWELSRIQSHAKEHSSSRLCYFAQDPVNGIDIEFLCSSEKLQTYLNVHSTPIPEDSPRMVSAHFYFGEEEVSCALHRLEGGQRLLLPEAISTRLVEALSAQKTVAIRLKGYQTEILPGEFNAKFKEMHHLTPFQNPFRSPL